MKYKEWLAEWLDFYVKPTTKERTHLKYLRIAENHIAPKLGDLELEELSARVLQKFTVGLSNDGKATNTVNGIVSVVKSSLKRAADAGIVKRQYSDAIVRPKTYEKNVACFDNKEQRRIEKYILRAKKFKLYGIIVCLYTGLRVGELLALKWENTDLDRGIITVVNGCRDKWTKNGYVKEFDTPKTVHSRRVIPVPKQLVPRLKELKKQGKSEMVVSSKSGKQISVRSYQRTFELLLKRLNITHKGFHALRHTFATRALECGMDVKTLADIMGHTNPTVTLNRYAHSMIEHKTAMMNKLGKLLD